MPSKKKDKNARESVVAAVTKHATKLSNAKETASTPDSPDKSPQVEPVLSPELKPSTPASIPTNGTAAPSPLLDAVSTTSVSASTALSANEWTKNIGPMAGSPNLISLMGESPPTQPSSYEDHRAVPYNWAPSRGHAQPNPAYSASPPNATGRRPLSFQMEAQFPANDIRSQASSPLGIRRSSMHSPFPQPRVGGHPPLPHQPQAHFYGAPDIDFDPDTKVGLKAGDRGYFYGFDTLPNAGNAQTLGSGNVVIAGYEGGLEIYSVSKRGVEPLTRLQGLRGGVHNAKILPWTSTVDRLGIFPLIAIVVHGPLIPSSAPEIAVEGLPDEAASPRLDATASPQPDVHQRNISTGKAVPMIEAYQTSVEVYSLKTNRRVDVLLQAPKISVKTLITSPVFRSPPPSGAFQIRADDGNIVVSSGITGECWIYRQAMYESDSSGVFRCVGKLWTSLQQGLKGDATPEEPEGARSPLPSQKNPQNPIIAVSGSWLAYCPPTPSSQIALNASIPVPIEGKAPGLATLTSPVLPTESSEVDQPISDSMMNRIMRETTQGLIQASRVVGKQGMQLWNNYWKPGQQPPSRPPSVGSPPWNAAYGGRPEASQFPPTYGVSGQAVTKDPGLVSILDMESLSTSSSPHHLATFKAPLGCSFLSFSPAGLSLFTASSKGDVQTIWDLMRIQHTKASALQASQPNAGHASRVRQIAQFSRMTVARIVDVAWAKPNGERAAMVTERGTVHLLDMPPSAYTWPPPRRRVQAQEAGAAGSENTPSAVSMASNALSSAYDAARPLMSVRRRSASNTHGSSTFMDHASYGGKVLAAGISHSLGNAGTAINHLRHTGENRVSLPVLNMVPGLSCVVWITGKKYHTLYVLGDGLVRVFPSKSHKSQTARERQKGSRGNKYRDFKLKLLPDDLIAPVVKQFIERDEDLDLAQQDYDTTNTLVLNPGPQHSISDLSPESSIPQAEIESSAPYQPFHTDRRVGLYEFGAESDRTGLASVSRALENATLDETPKKSKKPKAKTKESENQAWAFGQPIESVKVDLGLPVEDDIGNSTDDHRALPASAIERVLQVGENDEQIVVTTRRRRGGNRPTDMDDDGFFEDDCEVLDFADQRV